MPLHLFYHLINIRINLLQIEEIIKIFVIFYDVRKQFKYLYSTTISFWNNTLKTYAFTFRLNELLFNIYNDDIHIQSQKAENL